ncbi:MAG TPA: hypothetical protein VMS86_05580, partial [Thermoanaerobaculia bacterium]|nr:hypothetical protein [Thermoanaerobaculia bacterium]
MRAFTAASVAASLLFLLASSGGAQDGPLVSEADFLAPLERGEHPAVSALTREIGEAQAAEIAARSFSAPELG